MIAQIANWMRPILEFSLIRKIRRNHALEHATIHMLSRKFKDLPLIAAHSNNSGFVVLGDVPTHALESAVREAMARLQAGESEWAIHPNCGTNLATAGGLATISGWVGLGGGKKLTIDRLSWTLTLMILAIIISQPLGMRLQQHITTKADVGDLELLDIKRREFRLGHHKWVTHTVITRRG